MIEIVDDEQGPAIPKPAPKPKKSKTVPPPEVCYVAGAALAMKNAFSVLLDEWAWFKSQLRNYMLANGLTDMECPVAGEVLRVRLVTNAISVCQCHFLDLSACSATLEQIARHEPAALRTFEESSVTISVIKDSTTKGLADDQKSVDL